MTKVISARDHYRRADRDTLVKVGDIVIQHADAAIGHETADRARHVGAMDRIFSAGQRHRGDAHRISRRAAGNDARHRRLVMLHFSRRRPCGFEILAVDPGGAGPLLAGHAVRYPVGVVKAGKQGAGTPRIDGKYLEPAWSPPAEVKHDKPSMPDVIPGGSPRNPMGVAAMTLAGGE